MGEEGRGRDGTGREGRGGEWTGRGVVAGWEVLEDEVPGQRRVPLLVVNIVEKVVLCSQRISYNRDEVIDIGDMLIQHNSFCKRK